MVARDVMKSYVSLENNTRQISRLRESSAQGLQGVNGLTQTNIRGLFSSTPFPVHYQIPVVLVYNGQHIRQTHSLKEGHPAFLCFAWALGYRGK